MSSFATAGFRHGLLAAAIAGITGACGPGNPATDLRTTAPPPEIVQIRNCAPLTPPSTTEPTAVGSADDWPATLFTVRSTFTGPWRIGYLDRYDGARWQAPEGELTLRPIGRAVPGGDTEFTIAAPRSVATNPATG